MHIPVNSILPLSALSHDRDIRDTSRSFFLFTYHLAHPHHHLPFSAYKSINISSSPSPSSTLIHSTLGTAISASTPPSASASAQRSTTSFPAPGSRPLIPRNTPARNTPRTSTPATFPSSPSAHSSASSLHTHRMSRPGDTLLSSPDPELELELELRSKPEYTSPAGVIQPVLFSPSP
jgi:hypothetical protein